jgi:hypothetical protein
MGHFVPLAEGVDAGAAGFVEAGGVEDPPARSVSVVSHRRLAGIGGRGGRWLQESCRGARAA